MRSGVKRSFGWLAILVFALHAVLSGVALPAAASTLDPFSVICHSGVQADPADQSPDTPQPVACDHCTLCGAAAHARPHRRRTIATGEATAHPAPRSCGRA
jgi:hypothetical protein